MFKNTDYSALTIEELKVKESDSKKYQIGYVVFAISAGALTLFSIYKKNTGFIHSVLPLISVLLLSKSGTNLKKIQAEIIKKSN